MILYLIYSFSVSSIRQQPVETTVEDLTNLKCKIQAVSSYPNNTILALGFS